MKILLFIFSILLTNIIHAQDAELTALQFLHISPSPVASALGNAYTSISGNSDTMFYNPGSLAFLKLSAFSPVTPDSPFIRNISFSLAYSSWFYNLNYIAFSSMFDLKNVGIIGLGFTTMLYDNIDETMSSGVLTGQQLGSSDYLFMVSYANMLGEKIGLGGSIKFVIENAANENISGLACDAGIRYHENESKWSIGFVVQNAGLSIKKIDQSFQLPLDFKLGGNYDFNIIKNNNIILTSDIGTGLDYDYVFLSGNGI